MYFSGFCLEGEKELFKDYIIENDFSVSGFSYGAIKAFQYTLNEISLNKRVDKLQLFSPSYFLNESKKFKRMQIMYYKKDKNEYINNFLNNIKYPSDIDVSKYLKIGIVEELDELLNYAWNKDDLQILIDANVKIEVYIGDKDRIINPNETAKFFKEFAEVYYIKSLGHILK